MKVERGSLKSQLLQCFFYKKKLFLFKMYTSLLNQKNKFGV